MKNEIFSSLSAIILIMSVFACETPDMDKGVTYNKGLLNFYVKIPGESSEYGASNVGPYADGDTLYVKVPTSEESPLDVTRLIPYASLENNSYVYPAIEGVTDFSTPLQIKVVDGLGVQRTHYIKILPTPPKTLFKKMWFKNATDMGIVYTNISGMTVTSDKLFVHDANIWSAGGVGVRVFDRMTGNALSTIPSPATFTMQVEADDAGHIIINRYNEYSAGFIVYFYEDASSPSKEILKFTMAQGCPAGLGNKISVIGNLKAGKAFIYATAPKSNVYYYWEFMDGVCISDTPYIVKYASAKEPWTYACIKRASLDDAADHYITYCVYDSKDNVAQTKGSRFEVFPPDMDLVQMNRKSHLYKIFDFDVFTINGDTFLATLEQGFWAWDGVVLKVYEITNKDNLTLVPDDADYSKFKLFQSEVYGEVNYNRWGDVAVQVDGLNAYIYATIACKDAAKSGVMAYKMTYFPQ